MSSIEVHSQLFITASAKNLERALKVSSLARRRSDILAYYQRSSGAGKAGRSNVSATAHTKAGASAQIGVSTIRQVLDVAFLFAACVKLFGQAVRCPARCGAA